MKKLVALGFIVGSLAYAGDLSNLEATYQGLEQEYNLLMQKEQEKFNEEKKIAEAAKATLAKQQEMYAMLENKVAQLNSVANTRFYKDNYEGLANKYQGLMVKLEKETIVQLKRKVFTDNSKCIEKCCRKLR